MSSPSFFRRFLRRYSAISVAWNDHLMAGKTLENRKFTSADSISLVHSEFCPPHGQVVPFRHAMAKRAITSMRSPARCNASWPSAIIRRSSSIMRRLKFDFDFGT